MNWEAIAAITEVFSLFASVAAFIFAWGARKSAANEELQRRVYKLEAQAEVRIDSDDVKVLSDEIHELRGELKHTVRTVERMNQFLMDRGHA